MAEQALILGNGPAPSGDWLHRLATGMKILCADGGANTAHRLGLEPHAVVGDLDSVDPSLRHTWPATRWIRVDADDTGTDLQKVLDYTVDEGIKQVMLVGFTGGRTDHMLWNLSLLPVYSGRLDLCITDDDCLMGLIQEHISFRAPVGLRLSLSPLRGPVEGITTSGLRWSLNDEVLIPGRRDGISNEVVAPTVQITVTGEEPLLLVLQREGAGADLDLMMLLDPSRED